MCMGDQVDMKKGDLLVLGLAILGSRQKDKIARFSSCKFASTKDCTRDF